MKAGRARSRNGRAGDEEQREENCEDRARAHGVPVTSPESGHEALNADESVVAAAASAVTTARMQAAMRRHDLNTKGLRAAPRRSRARLPCPPPRGATGATAAMRKPP